MNYREWLSIIRLAGCALISVGCHAKPCSDNGSPPNPASAGSVAALLPGESARRKDERLGISLLELLARPEEFSGRIVSVTGYLKMDVEEQLLYASEEFGRVGVLENAVSVETVGCLSDQEDADLLKRLERQRDTYVRIRARFMKLIHHAIPISPDDCAASKMSRYWRRRRGMARQGPLPMLVQTQDSSRTRNAALERRRCPLRAVSSIRIRAVFCRPRRVCGSRVRGVWRGLSGESWVHP
jgi:hypothetical protein